MLEQPLNFLYEIQKSEKLILRMGGGTHVGFFHNHKDIRGGGLFFCQDWDS
jgi:hypothetical protein